MDTTETVTALKALADKTSIYRIISVIKSEAGDVPFLTAYHPDRGAGYCEICWSDGSFDAWHNGKPVKFGLSEDEAARLLAIDYCTLKAAVIAKRLVKDGADAAVAFKKSYVAALRHHMLAN